MAKYVIDAWAWMEYLDGSELGKKASRIIEGEDVVTSPVTVTEVTSRVSRKGKDPEIAFNSIVSLSKVVQITPEFAKETGLRHSKIKKRIPNFSIGDAFVLQTAKSIGARILTGDPDFKGIKEAEMLD